MHCVESSTGTFGFRSVSDVSLQAVCDFQYI